MVKLAEIQTAYIIVAATGVLVAAVYYIIITSKPRTGTVKPSYS